VFVSYSAQNRPWVVQQLLPRLQRVGLKVVIDYLNFEVGVPILENIEAAILRSRRTVLIISAAWLADRFSSMAGVLVQYSDVSGAGRRLVPVLLEKCEVPLHLAALEAVSFLEQDIIAEQWDRLLRNLTEREPVAIPDHSPGTNGKAPTAAVWSWDPLQDEGVRKEVDRYQVVFEEVGEQIHTLADHKELHDWLHEIQVRCYNPALVAQLLLPAAADVAWPWLRGYLADLMTFQERIQQVAARRPSFTGTQVRWTGKLEEARLHLADACDRRSEADLKLSLGLLGEVIRREPPRISIRLNTLARDLRLGSLAEAMQSICKNLTAAKMEPAKVKPFQDRAADLEGRYQRLQKLVGEHELWQMIDDCLRMVETDLKKDDLTGLRKSWPDLQEWTGPLFTEGASVDVKRFKEDADRLDATLKANNPAEALEAFRTYRSRTIQLFYEVDKALKAECEALRQVGLSLTALRGGEVS
jgi:hypothetical protein